MSYLDNKIFYQLLLITICLFIAQPLFSQTKKNDHQPTMPAVKNNNLLLKPIATIPDFPAIINSKLNMDCSTGLADFIMKKLPDLYICSGEVYFSGAGFPYVQIILIAPCDGSISSGRKISNALKSLLPRCRPGSEITFIKCSFKSIAGTIGEPINRTVLIQ